MYFLSEWQQPICFLKKSPEIIKYILTCCFSILFLVIWYFIFYTAYWVEIEAYSKQIAVLQAKKNLTIPLANKNDQLVQVNRVHENAIQQEGKKLPQDFQPHLDGVVSSLKKHAITLHALQADKKQEYDTFCTAEYVLTVEAPYEKLVNLLKVLESLAPAIYCRGCLVEKREHACCATYTLCFLCSKERQQTINYRSKPSKTRSSRAYRRNK